MFAYNEDRLEAMEPQKHHGQYAKKLKKFLKFVILTTIFLTIVIDAFSNYGTEKIQVLSNKMRNEFYYDVKEHPLDKILPLHWFLELNREEVV